MATTVHNPVHVIKQKQESIDFLRSIHKFINSYLFPDEHFDVTLKYS